MRGGLRRSIIRAMERLTSGTRELGIALSEQHLLQLGIYSRELVEWSQRFNLTAITDHEGILIRHFLDSLSCLKGLAQPELTSSTRIIDVGTGAGFPGLPIKIACPAVQLTLLEATAKKVTFLRHLVEVLGLRGVEVIHGRAEELGRDPAHREQYDWALARAVAKMPTLAEYLLPLVRVGGKVLAQKGEGAAAEVHEAEAAITTSGGHVRRLVPVELHGLAETRYLVLLDKVAATPERYPRRAGMPVKRPIT